MNCRLSRLLSSILAQSSLGRDPESLLLKSPGKSCKTKSIKVRRKKVNYMHESPGQSCKNLLSPSCSQISNCTLMIVELNQIAKHLPGDKNCISHNTSERSSILLQSVYFCVFCNSLPSGRVASVSQMMLQGPRVIQGKPNPL